ncbi:hypothetical protein LY78DRAFT_150382 [Colletotrichum sublineola]|nr:hypothetical protein LY78DRAFT_150382 [Colletotrichum sublineola]
MMGGCWTPPALQTSGNGPVDLLIFVLPLSLPTRSCHVLRCLHYSYYSGWLCLSDPPFPRPLKSREWPGGPKTRHTPRLLFLPYTPIQPGSPSRRFLCFGRRRRPRSLLLCCALLLRILYSCSLLPPPPSMLSLSHSQVASYPPSTAHDVLPHCLCNTRFPPPDEFLGEAHDPCSPLVYL